MGREMKVVLVLLAIAVALGVVQCLQWSRRGASASQSGPFQVDPGTEQDVPVAATPPSERPIGSPSGPIPQPNKRPSPANPPYRPALMLQLWAFEADRVTYRNHGTMDVLTDNQSGFVPAANPTERGIVPTRLVTSPNITVYGYQQSFNHQGYPNLAPVYRPVEAHKAGTRLDYDVEIEIPSVPFLHVNEGRNRMLSINFAPFPGHPKTVYSFAVPDTSTGIVTSDAQPSGRRKWPGWLVYDYDSTNWGYTVIHIGFLVGNTTHAIPKGRAVFEGL